MRRRIRVCRTSDTLVVAEVYRQQHQQVLLSNWYESQKAAMIANGVEVMVIVGLHDRVQILNAIYKGSKSTNTAELQDANPSHFSRDYRVVSPNLHCHR